MPFNPAIKEGMPVQSKSSIASLKVMSHRRLATVSRPALVMSSEVLAAQVAEIWICRPAHAGEQ